MIQVNYRCLMWVTGFSIALIAVPAFGQVTITIKDRVAVDHTGVTIGEVATISGGTTNQQNFIAGLDLDVLDADGRYQYLTRREIEMRLLVAGYGRREFHLTGARVVDIRKANTSDFRKRLESLIHRELARQFGLESKNISIRIVGDEKLRSAESRIVGTDYSATVLFDSQLPVGKTGIQVEFTSPRDRFFEDFEAHVILSTEVAVAAGNVTRGTVIDASKIRVIRRPIVRKADFADPRNVVGRVAKVDILSNDVLLTSYLTETNQNRTTVIQRNDLIDVIVQLGGTEVRLKNARAMKAGNIGDTITVLNTRSHNQLSAKVVSRTEAVVSQDPRNLR
ncbi:MAG: flagellar basal body P-ring formation chaperone FlgA [Planctomycetota bacterium]